MTTKEAEDFHAAFGYNEVKPKRVPEWQKIVMRYLDWVCIVILIAAIVSVAVENEGSRGWTSFTLLILELNLIVWVGYYTDRNAGDAIKDLEKLSAPHTIALRDGQWVDLAVRELCMGDVIQLKGGDVIPADARLLGPGEPMQIDESSLTGESMAVTRRPGDNVLAGAVVAQGELEGVVTAVGVNTFFGKTMALLGRPEERGHLQTVLGRVTVALGIVSLAGVIAILAVLLGTGEPAGYAITTTFVVFVSVVPIGMPVVTGAVLAVGAREMAAEKAICSRLSALEELSGMSVLCSDKTGTLTLNRLTLDEAEIQPAAGYTPRQVLEMAALSAKWGSGQDAIDKAMTASVGGSDNLSATLPGWSVQRLVPFSPVDKKTSAWVTSPEGKKLVTTKGAPQIIADMLTDEAAKATVTEYIAERATRGLRALGVAESHDDGATWLLVGCIALLDPPREDSAATIKQAQALGVEVKMVTGDQLAIAIETSRRLGMGTNIMEGKELMAGGDSPEAIDALGHKAALVDGYAGVYPEHKFAIVQALQSHGRLVGMTGDGVNDAPALKRANVGIAVAGATDAAKGAADIILTQEGINTIITAINRSRVIFRRLESYIIYRIASSLTILFFFLLAIVIIGLEFPTWTLVLISLTNDLSAMATSYDKVYSSDLPETWVMTKCILVASVISIVNVGALMLLLCLSMPSIIDWWHVWNVSVGVDPPGGLLGTPSEVNAVMFIGITAAIQLSILSTRNTSFWWHFSKKHAPAPSLLLVVPLMLFIASSAFIAIYWPYSVQPDGGRARLEGAGWTPVIVAMAYVILWWQVADAAKVGVHKLYRAYDKAKTKATHDDVDPPGWVRAMDYPGEVADKVADVLEDATDRLLAAIMRPCTRKPGVIARPLSTHEIQTEVAARLSYRDMSGAVPEDIASKQEMITNVPNVPLHRHSAASSGTLRRVTANAPEGSTAVDHDHEHGPHFEDRPMPRKASNLARFSAF